MGLIVLFLPTNLKNFHEPNNFFYCFSYCHVFSFVVESAGTDCLRDLQETAPDPRLIVYPEVDTPVSLSPSKSESEYPIKLKSSTCVYLIPRS